jgi:hypothetical protein
MIRTLSIALLLAAACGGKDKTAPAKPASTEMQHEGGEHHPPMSAEMTAFHDVLKPRWHAEPGAQRTKDTCDAVPQFQTDADAVAKSVPPQSTHADAWTASTRALVAAVADLDTACKSNDAAKFDAAFGKVHEAFHSLMAQGGGEEHEKMGAGGGEHVH